MYCIGCGIENMQGSARCIRCGHDLSSLRTDLYKSAPVGSSSVVLWNPDVAALLSLPFTPLFGTVIHALNWRRLGQPHRATAAWGWVAVAFVLFIVVPFGASVAGYEERSIDGFLRIANMVALVIWYFTAARGQSKYVTKELRNEYVKESWFTPIWIVLMIVATLYALIGAMG